MDRTTRSVTCDGCQDELTEDTQYPHRWAFVLTVKDYATHTSGVMYSVHIPKPLDGDRHFCCIECLQEWAGKQSQ